MALYVNDSGTWREALVISVKDSGVWRSATKVEVKDSGVWRTVFPTALNFSSSTPGLH